VAAACRRRVLGVVERVQWGGSTRPRASQGSRVQALPGGETASQSWNRRGRAARMGGGLECFRRAMRAAAAAAVVVVASVQRDRRVRAQTRAAVEGVDAAVCSVRCAVCSV
jgi:hypothetical protein